MLINPTVELADDIDVDDESCLSLPGRAPRPCRGAIAGVRYRDINAASAS